MFVSTYYVVANVNQSTRTVDKTSHILVTQTLVNITNMIERKLFKHCAYLNVITIYNTFFYLYIYKKNLASPTPIVYTKSRDLVYGIFWYVLTLCNVPVLQINCVLCSVNISNFHSTTVNPRYN